MLDYNGLFLTSFLVKNDFFDIRLMKGVLNWLQNCALGAAFCLVL